jgi:alpha-galactosidase
LDPSDEVVPGYLWTQPATLFAASSTTGRSFTHRRLWLNDPDCLMLRRTHTELSTDAIQTWAHLVGLSGGMALVSDDLSLLGPPERRLLDQVLELGRRSDAAAREGRTPVVPDRLTQSVPMGMAAVGQRLELDPVTGRSELTAAAGD